MNDLFAQTLKKKKTNRPPIWFMRQAGRYLPEYNKTKKKAGSFLDLCMTAELACEVTLQPIERFQLDAAILFSDILTIPYALGQTVEFKPEKGPILTPAIREKKQLKIISFEKTKLDPVFKTVSLIKTKLQDKNTSLIGFSGAPWTLLAYMIEGQGSRDYEKAFQFYYNEPSSFYELIEILVEAISYYLIEQVKAGAEILNLFDSWAGIVPDFLFEDFIIKPTNAIIEKVRKIYPKVPIITFPRGSGVRYERYTHEVDTDIIALDQMIPLHWAKKTLPKKLIFQGNFNPMTLAYGTKEQIKREASYILHMLEDRPFIFNLGHGILKTTPIENVHFLLNFIRGEE